MQYDLLSVAGGKVIPPRKCSACDLSNSGLLQTNCMDGHGAVGARFMFAGKAPGEEDDKIGAPMTGRNGRLFYELITAADFDQRDIYVTNALKCTTFNADPTIRQWNACKAHFLKEINEIKPRVIIAVGAEALKFLTGETGVDRLRRIGIPCLLDPSIPVFSMFQPARLFHVYNPLDVMKMRSEMVNDLIWIKRNAVQMADKQMSGEGVVDYKVAKTIQDVRDLVRELDQYGELSCDFETDGLEAKPNKKIVAAGFSAAARHARVIPLYANGIRTMRYWEDGDLQEASQLVSGLLQRHKVFGHNFLKFDEKWAYTNFGIEKLDVGYDTQIVQYIIDPESSLDLEYLARLYTSMRNWKKDFTLEDTEGLCGYLCKDVDAPWRIRAAQEKLLSQKQWWLLRTLMIPLSRKLREMEMRGVEIDKQEVTRLLNEYEKQMAAQVVALKAMPEVAALEISQAKDFNPGADQQVAALMFNVLKLPSVKKTAKGGRESTDKEVLEKYKDNPAVSRIRAYRDHAKMRGTYCEGIISRMWEDGRIHGSFRADQTTTGRLACRDPNLQNIPRVIVDKSGKELVNIKRMFIPGDGRCFLEADYSQAELRTLAALANCPTLQGIYARGEDAHAATAAQAYAIPISQVTSAQRHMAKAINFGIIYGKHEETLVTDFKDAGNTEEQARFFYSNHKKTFPSVWEFMELQEYLIRTYGFQETWFGRRRRYSEVTSDAIRAAYNFPIQSSASDVTLFAFIRCADAMRKLGLDAYPVITVHDSILFSVNLQCFWDVAEMVSHIMSGVRFEWMKVPFEADLKAGLTWGSLKEVDLSNRCFK